jgi:hypothetical protein
MNKTRRNRKRKRADLRKITCSWCGKSISVRKGKVREHDRIYITIDDFIFSYLECGQHTKLSGNDMMKIINR